jgi:hypothetical protein
LDFNLRIFGSDYTVHSDDFGSDVEEYLKENTDTVVAPAVVDLLCQQFTTLLDSLKETIETLPLLQDAEGYVDPFAGPEPAVLNLERALSPPETVSLVDFKTNELFRTVVEVLFAVDQNGQKPQNPNPNPALQQIQKVLDGLVADQVRQLILTFYFVPKTLTRNPPVCLLLQRIFWIFWDQP